eukprot:86746_1
MAIAIFSEECLVIILFITFLATQFLGTAMLMEHMVDEACVNMNGIHNNPHFFSIGTCVFMAYYLRYFIIVFCKNSIGEVCQRERLAVAYEVIFGSFWFCWGIRGSFLYAMELSSACQATHTGKIVLAYCVLLITIGLTWIYQGVTAAKQIKHTEDLTEDLLDSFDAGA